MDTEEPDAKPQRHFDRGLEQAVDRHSHAVIGRHSDQPRALPFERMKDVDVRGKVERLADGLVATAREVEARMDERLADRDVLVHHDFAGARADDLAYKIADRARHLPPALFPCAYAAR